jgi:hypothetical protein
VGNILAKAAGLRVNSNIDGAPTASKSCSHPSHSLTVTLKGRQIYGAPGTASDFCSICLVEDQTGDKPIPIGKISDELFRISSITIHLVTITGDFY